MGIDLYKRGRIQSRTGRAPTTTNLYHRLLIKLYKFLARRTDSKFNKIVYKRLCQSNTTRYPISISKLAKHIKDADAKDKDRILVVVGNVLNDERILTVPKIKVCALRFTEEARKRIVKAGGQCLTFDKLAKIAPLGEKTLLLRGAHKREALKHFGPAPGARHSHTKPHVLYANHKGQERKNGHVKK